MGEQLAAVERLLAEQLASPHPFVDRLVRHGYRLGGKRLRPALVLLSGACLGRVDRSHVVLATVMEMIHTATLVHDDVLDGATLRRHVDTLNVLAGTEASVLLGDFLFSRSFHLASTLGQPWACELIGRSTTIVCEGELRQLGTRGRFDLGEDEYLSVIDAKTAELCACCCGLGARAAGGTPEQVEALEGYGRALGVAFQMVDDLLDLTGDERTTGKSLGTDRAQQKLTLPWIHALRRAPADRRSALVAGLTDPASGCHGRLLDELADLGGLEYTEVRAREFSQQAQGLLERIPSSASRDTLARLAVLAVDRRA